MDFNLLFGIFCILGLIILNVEYVLNTIKKLKLKLRTKNLNESIVEVEMKNKNFVHGFSEPMSLEKGKGFTTNRIDSYLVEFEYKEKVYTIDSKYIFEKYNIGDLVKIKLVESLDKNNLILKSEFFADYKL
ncbi:hypothetical protein [Faecalimicrobium sp. JNUCC 81]